MMGVVPSSGYHGLTPPYVDCIQEHRKCGFSFLPVLHGVNTLESQRCQGAAHVSTHEGRVPRPAHACRLCCGAGLKIGKDGSKDSHGRSLVPWVSPHYLALNSRTGSQSKEASFERLPSHRCCGSSTF